MSRPKGATVRIEQYAKCVESQQRWQMIALLYRTMLVNAGVEDAVLSEIWNSPKNEVVKQYFIEASRDQK